uniref:Uncharacterized protein n=1 Tax=Rhizophora mucronata TaxID=61149 RepID=A0A2P2R2T1_RHIMU
MRKLKYNIPIFLGG